MLGLRYLHLVLAVGALHGLPDQNDQSSVRELWTPAKRNAANEANDGSRAQTNKMNEKQQRQRNKAAPAPSAFGSVQEESMPCR